MKGHGPPFLLALALSGCVAGMANYATPFSNQAFVPGRYQYPPNQDQNRPAPRDHSATDSRPFSTPQPGQTYSQRSPGTPNGSKNTARHKSVFDVTITDIIIAFAAVVSAFVGAFVLGVYRCMGDG